MYIAALIIPVPKGNLEAYKKWAVNSAAIFKKYGCLEIIDGWDDFVPRGKTTDMYRAVNAKEDEKIAVSLQVWPDKEMFYASEEKMHADDALEVDGEVPFDGSRLVLGCFESLQNDASGQVAN